MGALSAKMMLPAGWRGIPSQIAILLNLFGRAML